MTFFSENQCYRISTSCGVVNMPAGLTWTKLKSTKDITQLLHKM